jgi:hypothetical protein
MAEEIKDVLALLKDYQKRDFSSKIADSDKTIKSKSVELKKYKDYKKNPLHLSNPDSSKFSLTFPAQNRIIKTDSLYFTPLLKDLGSKKIIELNRREKCSAKQYKKQD